jgi:two-component system sensor histidine kinase and response regulator WspE
VSGNLSAFSMWDLFRGEVETQMRALTDGLLALERGERTPEHLASAMRAAHSIKGAARIVQFDAGVGLAHLMEDCLVAAQEKALSLEAASIDVLLTAGDLLATVARVDEAAVPEWIESHRDAIAELVTALEDVRAGRPVSRSAGKGRVAEGSETDTEPVVAAPPEPAEAGAAPPPAGPAAAPIREADGDRSLRVSAHMLNRLMGLAGEALVQSRWLEPFGTSFLAFRRQQAEIAELLESLQPMVDQQPKAAAAVQAARRKVALLREFAAERQASFDEFALRSSGLSDRLYREVVASRMRPFGDRVEAFPRLVRDLARQLGKQAQLEIVGRSTEVDREILERLEAPLNHMLRNAVDHGIESPAERTAAGKPPIGTIKLEARHRAGLFVLTLSDDGRGVDVEMLRDKIVARSLTTPELAASLSEAELLEFLFLPGFSTAASVTDVSGRGVGLDVVQDVAASVGGVVRISSRAGQGLTIQLELPLTLSVLRTLVAEIGGEPFAFPLTRIARVVKVPYGELTLLENQHYFTLDSERIGVVSAREVLDMSGDAEWPAEISIILLGDHNSRFGLAVDRFLGEYDMAVRPLDPRLGKVPDIDAAALMDDGSPVLIVDVDDLARSIENLLHGGRLRGIGQRQSAGKRRKRILVVDDSITVREVERSLLQNRGYEVEVAVDGMDGWNALRAASYDLTVTDVDMPRMTGIELVTRIKTDARLHALPVIIVSYKDRDEDRMRGLDAGADRYLTKSSFHDETLLTAVAELIGPPES